MRVVLDPRVVTGAGGGPEKTILTSPKFLRPLGYEMVCAYLHPPNDPGFEHLVRRADASGAPLVSVPDCGPLDFGVVRQLLSTCRERNVEIWHGHDYKTNALGLVLARFHRMRLVTTLHGWVERTTRTPAYFRIDKLCLPFYERVYAVSADLADAARRARVRPSRVITLENGIDLGDYRRVLSVREAKAALGLPPDSLVVGGVGRLSAEKAFAALVESVAELVRRGFDARLVIVGEGGERANLGRQIGESGLGGRVTLAGFQRDVRPYFQAFDVFALPSLREGLPNALLEAMAFGVPSVASRVAGIPKVITDGVDGVLIEPGDAGQLTEALTALLGDPAKRASMGAAARATVEARYSFAERMRKLAASYDELLGPARRRGVY